jgi:hypothetical protein
VMVEMWPTHAPTGPRAHAPTHAARADALTRGRADAPNAHKLKRGLGLPLVGPRPPCLKAGGPAPLSQSLEGVLGGTDKRFAVRALRERLRALAGGPSVLSSPARADLNA